jgi:hypothetical protein
MRCQFFLKTRKHSADRQCANLGLWHIDGQLVCSVHRNVLRRIQKANDEALQKLVALTRR